MELATFIRTHAEDIMKEWEVFARDHIPIARDIGNVELRDHLVEILNFIADDLASPQTSQEQEKKSQGVKRRTLNVRDSAAEKHADLRFIEGFDALELVSEFRALRASIIQLWEEKRPRKPRDYAQIVRFNEAVDQILTEGLARYTDHANRSRNLFLAMLVHDLRNPLNTISMSARVLLSSGHLDVRQKTLATQIDASTSRTVKLVADLIDDVRARLGKGLPLHVAEMDMESTMRGAIKEARIAHPDNAFSITTTGNMMGEWDSSRMEQVLSNLLGNAAQHGEKKSPIIVRADGRAKDIILSVHNKGRPIPAKSLPLVFEPMTSGDEEPLANNSSSLGLGLFITKEIVEAHGGVIEVESSKAKGTTFTMKIPRGNQYAA